MRVPASQTVSGFLMRDRDIEACKAKRLQCVYPGFKARRRQRQTQVKTFDSVSCAPVIMQDGRARIGERPSRYSRQDGLAVRKSAARSTLAPARVNSPAELRSR